MRHPSTPPPPPDRRLVTLPPLVTLSAQQQRGVHCVFCGTALHTGAVRDLGPQLAEAHGSVVRWFPRSCHSCPKERALPLTCDRCGRPIAAGDEERVTIHGGSGPGGTLTVHAAYCPPPRPGPPSPVTPQKPAMDLSSTPPTAP
ncbi:hypothetical protein [Streptomyces sp. OR43]|uniref:hypothetical protein n=1 Tax=Streptomyces sp. or43 TaxID=2478957 RepID=UPI00165139DA|nr:hypothetical protein [Streptomyces sp. or43]